MASNVCSRCGDELPEIPGGGHGWVKCQICGEAVEIGADKPYQAPTHFNLKATDSDVKPQGGLREVARPRSVRSLRPQPSISPSPTPSDMPALPKDLDKALATYALGLFRVRGWPCQELPGYKAFVVRARISHPESGNTDVCNVTISAARGVLTLETVVRNLPPPPWHTLRETLNALNIASGGSLFLMRECGIVVRYRLLPQTSPEGRFNVDHILAALMQMNHDRRLAMQVLFMASQWSVFDGAAVRKTFAQPVARPQQVEQRYLQDLAGFAGYYAFPKGGELGLNKELCAPSDCPVNLKLDRGMLRAWTTLNTEIISRLSGERWGFVRQMMRSLSRPGLRMTHNQRTRMIEHLNGINDTSALLRYVWQEEQLRAVATYNFFGQDMTVENFQTIVDALFRRTRSGPGHTTLCLRQAV
ncbi:MAG: hypothetical protein HS116_17335 [Planctomycetes bacterium]|nr:hypothetical protein [Planctomycetota bacterium]